MYESFPLLNKFRITYIQLFTGICLGFTEIYWKKINSFTNLRRVRVSCELGLGVGKRERQDGVLCKAFRDFNTNIWGIIPKVFGGYFFGKYAGSPKFNVEFHELSFIPSYKSGWLGRMAFRRVGKKCLGVFLEFDQLQGS